jgi:hypothetical protein
MADQTRTLVGADRRQRTADLALRTRAAAVIPGGMYGHQSAGRPRWLTARTGLGRQWLISPSCSWRPSGTRTGRCSPRMAPTPRRCAVRSRGRRLGASGSWSPTAPTTAPRHGARRGSRERLRRTGPTSATTRSMTWPARSAAAEAGGDLAAVIVSPFRHDAGYDQELVDPAFAAGLRDLCDASGAALILDDVRCGFRLHLGGSWEPIGVEPGLSAWSKAIANGHPLAAVLGNDNATTCCRSRATCER